MITTWETLVPEIAKRTGKTEAYVKNQILTYSEDLLIAVRNNKRLEFDFFYLGKLTPYCSKIKAVVNAKVSRGHLNPRVAEYCAKLLDIHDRYLALLKGGKSKAKLAHTPYKYEGSYVNYKKAEENAQNTCL